MLPCKEYLICHMPENEELLDEIIELLDGESTDYLEKVYNYMFELMKKEIEDDKK